MHARTHARCLRSLCPETCVLTAPAPPEIDTAAAAAAAAAAAPVLQPPKGAVPVSERFPSPRSRPQTSRLWTDLEISKSIHPNFVAVLANGEFGCTYFFHVRSTARFRCCDGLQEEHAENLTQPTYTYLSASRPPPRSQQQVQPCTHAQTATVHTNTTASSPLASCLRIARFGLETQTP
jgi:hypothetical protein